ncbi:MAG: hypothetical protein KKA84_02245 [Bacteroidetes bacterium]|nr:hypothetical protein [Bacteroidota bacterium]
MNKPILVLFFILFNNANFGQNIYTSLPQKIDPSAKYIFYLHGHIVELSGRHPHSEEYGYYEYDKIIGRLAESGSIVLGEVRQPNTDRFEYAKKVSAQIDSLMSSGVEPENITVIGASRGAFITMLISNELRNKKINYVLLAIFNKRIVDIFIENNFILSGRILYIVDESDKIAGSSKPFLEKLQNESLLEFKEIITHMGNGHGLLFQPYDEWVLPALDWAKGTD